jgi:HAE1 family hydrophobic/amphiphilic exporter-1
VITLYITPVIYLFLDKYSGSGPMNDADLDDSVPPPEKAPVELKAVNLSKH